MSGGTTEQIRGRVEQTNEKGLKIDGRWFNWSQYSRSTVRPDEGDDVELEIARGKFINDARIVGKGEENALPMDDEDPFNAPSSSSAASAAPPRASTRRSEPASASRSASSSPMTASSTPNYDRNTEIRRLALIKAAADFAATRGMEPGEVVPLASLWEEWVTERS